MTSAETTEAFINTRQSGITEAMIYEYNEAENFRDPKPFYGEAQLQAKSSRSDGAALALVYGRIRCEALRIFELTGIDIFGGFRKSASLTYSTFLQKPTSPSRAGNSNFGAPLGIHVQKYQSVEEDPLLKNNRFERSLGALRYFGRYHQLTPRGSSLKNYHLILKVHPTTNFQMESLFRSHSTF